MSMGEAACHDPRQAGRAPAIMAAMASKVSPGAGTGALLAPFAALALPPAAAAAGP